MESLFKWSRSIDYHAHIFFFKTKNCLNNDPFISCNDRIGKMLHNICKFAVAMSLRWTWAFYFMFWLLYCFNLCIFCMIQENKSDRLEFMLRKYYTAANESALTHLCLASYKRDIGKQSRSWSDATECGISSTLFAFITGISINMAVIKTRASQWQAIAYPRASAITHQNPKCIPPVLIHRANTSDSFKIIAPKA